MPAKCVICDDKGWVCEHHPDSPSGLFSLRFDACDCGGAAMPCTCNPCDQTHPPDWSRAGVRIICDRQGWRH